MGRDDSARPEISNPPSEEKEMIIRNACPRSKRGQGARLLGNAGATLVLSGMMLASMVGTAAAEPSVGPTMPVADQSTTGQLASADPTPAEAEDGPQGPSRIRCFAIVWGQGPACPTDPPHRGGPPQHAPPVKRCFAIVKGRGPACP